MRVAHRIWPLPPGLLMTHRVIHSAIPSEASTIAKITNIAHAPCAVSVRTFLSQ